MAFFRHHSSQIVQSRRFAASNSADFARIADAQAAPRLQPCARREARLALFPLQVEAGRSRSAFAVLKSPQALTLPVRTGRVLRIITASDRAASAPSGYCSV